MRALAIAATGMNAQEQNLEVIANNIANLNTTGFKRSRAEFTDLIYQTERVMGVSSRGRDATVPEGAQVGPRRAHRGDPHLANPRRAHQHRQHARPRDQRARLVPSDDPGGRHRLYARRRVQHQRDGTIGDRRRLHRDPGDPDPGDRDQRHREPDGPGDRDDLRTDDAPTARPVDDRQFHQRSRACRRWEAISFSKPRRRVSRPVGVPGDTAFGVIQQGYLEASNVDPVSEITNLIGAQRAYEMNSKVIQAADQMSGTISNMRG